MGEILKELPEWGEGQSQYVDFIVTEDCNLRCKYCYVCKKRKIML